ncbi:MAG: Arc family DNA-binding protein [Burkholderiales bacterium]
MAKEQSVPVTLRVPETIRELLRAAAEKDHRSMANMLEVLIIRHCEANGIAVPPPRKGRKATPSSRSA